MGARYYHPLSGRFISPDPLGLTGSLDLYNYADGDPINYFDPDGRLLMASWGNVKDFHVNAGRKIVSGTKKASEFSIKYGNHILDGAQVGLDVAGMVPGLGIVPDFINAGVHTLRGQYVEAGISVGAAIPIIGDIAKAVKLGGDVYNRAKGFTKAADKELKAMGYQQHHIISHTNAKTKSHDLLKLANFDLQSTHNLMYLPSKAGLHPTRSLHRGKHFDDVSRRMEKRMDDIVKKGNAGDWTTNQYNEALMDILKDMRSQLKQSKIKLNNAK
ncbi:MAG: hypothetical protein C5B43_01735 [Verrucomicrobia bacterium]|nr:MAG: hypothetical protein C5B43_01735 [Verrucomicrobiota bacterium]